MGLETKKNIIESEIQLADDECCIIFDICGHNTNPNAEVSVEFALDSQPYADFTEDRKNYTGKKLTTVVKTYSQHQKSHLGYPIIMKLDEQTPQILHILLTVEMEEFSFTHIMSFPLLTTMTAEKPFCWLSFCVFACPPERRDNTDNAWRGFVIQTAAPKVAQMENIDSPYMWFRLANTDKSKIAAEMLSVIRKQPEFTEIPDPKMLPTEENDDFDAQYAYIDTPIIAHGMTMQSVIDLCSTGD